MENLLQKINNLSTELNALLPMSKAFQQKLDEKFRLEFSYNSNHIEGNTLTYLETKLLLLKDIAEGENHTFREFEEMKAHDAAYVLIQNWAKEKRLLTEVEIKQLNKIILVKNYWNDAQTPDGKATRREIQVGEYKQFPNSVRLQNGEMYEYASPIDTPIKMDELMQWLNDEIEKNTLHPLELAALLHYKFVCIHPFDDGNGRISRLLMNYVLLKNNFPPVIIKSKDKKNYLLALNKADAGDEQAFVKYIAEQLIWSLETSIKAAKGESIVEPDDIDKEIELLKKKFQNQQILNKKISVENVAEIIEKILIPVFKIIEIKCGELIPLFFDYNIRREFEYRNESGSRLVGTKESNYKDLIKNWIHYQVISHQKIVSSFKYSYELKGLKSTVNANDVWLRIEVTFKEYYFEINTKSIHEKFPYDKNFTEDYIENIANHFIIKLVNDIKNISNQ